LRDESHLEVCKNKIEAKSSRKIAKKNNSNIYRRNATKIII
jgi:hypothetical protein